MSVPDLDACLRRGAVFLWRDYDKLDDPNVRAKAKFIVLVNAFLPDENLYYLLTTSQVDRLKKGPFIADVVVIPAGTYEFFPIDTAINVASIANTPPIEASLFREMYYDREIVFVGALSSADIGRLDAATNASVRVPKDMKRFITAW